MSVRVISEKEAAPRVLKRRYARPIIEHEVIIRTTLQFRITEGVKMSVPEVGHASPWLNEVSAAPHERAIYIDAYSYRVLRDWWSDSVVYTREIFTGNPEK